MRIDNTNEPGATPSVDLCSFCGAGWPEEIRIEHPPYSETDKCGDDNDDCDDNDEEGEICPYCNGTNISPYERDGGSCPHCFGGKLK